MSKIIRFIFILGIIIMSANVSASAQRYKRMCYNPNEKHTIWTPKFSVRPHRASAVISYDAASMVLTVKFPSNGGTLIVTHNGTQVASMTAGSGTTFRSELRQYGTGNYTVIVSNGKTVVEIKNYVVR